MRHSRRTRSAQPPEPPASPRYGATERQPNQGAHADFSEHSAACLQKSAHLFGDDRPREFHFVHVRHTPTDASIWAGDNVADAQTHVDGVTTGFEHPGQAERRSVVLTGHTSTEICKYAGDNACDLIVMATHRRTGLAHMVMGSTAEQVVRHAPCPVLTMRANI